MAAKKKTTNKKRSKYKVARITLLQRRKAEEMSHSCFRSHNLVYEVCRHIDDVAAYCDKLDSQYEKAARLKSKADYLRSIAQDVLEQCEELGVNLSELEGEGLL